MAQATVHTATEVQRLADFATVARWQDVSAPAREALRVRLLDAVACALGARLAQVPQRIRGLVEADGGAATASLIGGGASTPDRAALYNGAMVRYLDFNDAYLAPGETCHPSDNIAPLLAAAESSGGGSLDFLTGLAVAYQVQCRLSDEAPVRGHGFDHSVQGAYAVAAGAARAMRLSQPEAANGIAIAGTSQNALRVTRTGILSNWKGLAYPFMAAGALQSIRLAAAGITGPLEVFEGNKGLKDAIAGPFTIDWRHEDLERVRHTITKRYNAEIHAQSAIEGVLELRAKDGGPRPDASISLETFQVAYDIIGGGEEGGKKRIRTKEEADHSLPYMLAVAYLDGELTPRQYLAERILADDVQALLQRVAVRPAQDLSERFPKEMACRLAISTPDGRVSQAEKRDYLGFTSRPAPYGQIADKLVSLGDGAPKDLIARIVDTVHELENRPLSDLTTLIRQIPVGGR